MKALVKTREGVFLKDVPVPKVGKTDILIKVMLAGFCRTDSYVAKNLIKTKTPLILGHEFSGVVEKTGSGIKKFKPGDRVGVMPILSDNQGRYTGDMIGVERDGCFAEYVSVPETAAHKIPAGLPFKEAAYLEPVTSSLAVLNVPLKKDWRGVIAGDNRIAKLTERILRGHGFRKIKIVPMEKLNEIQNNEYDFAIETVATTNVISQLIRKVKPGGIMIMKSRQFDPVKISIGEIVKKDIRIFGAYYGSFKKAIKILQSKKLKLETILGETLPLKKAAAIVCGKTRVKEDRKIFFDPTCAA